MGTYLKIPKKAPESVLRSWFDKWKPFYNDFGDEHTFDDVFGDILANGEINFKIEGGIPLKPIYKKEAVEEIKKLIVEFGGDPKEK